MVMVSQRANTPLARVSVFLNLIFDFLDASIIRRTRMYKNVNLEHVVL